MFLRGGQATVIKSLRYTSTFTAKGMACQYDFDEGLIYWNIQNKELILAKTNCYC